MMKVTMMMAMMIMAATMVAAAPVRLPNGGCNPEDWVPANTPVQYVGYEPPLYCFNASASPSGQNGFSVVFEQVTLPTGDDICAIIALAGASPYPPYVVSQCPLTRNSSMSFGGTCSATTRDSEYWFAIGSKSALFTPNPKMTLLQFTFHVEWSHTYVC